MKILEKLNSELLFVSAFFLSILVVASVKFEYLPMYVISVIFLGAITYVTIQIKSFFQRKNR